MSAAAFSTVRLADVCEFKPSKSIAKRALSDDALVSFAPMNDLGELRMEFQPSAERPLAEVLKSYTYFADGDVICAKITPCFENGKMGLATGLMNGVGFGSSEFVVMRPSPRLLPQYLFYFMLRDDFRAAGAKVMTGAVGHKRVPNEFFEELKVPLPPVEQQQRIVAVLDQAFAALDRARALAEANLADVSTLRGQYLDDQIAKLFAEFGSIKVNEIADVKGGKRLPKGQKTASEVTPYSYISVRDMTDDGTVDTASVQYISQTNRDAIKRYTISSSDVYVSIAGTIGKTGVVPAELDGANLTENAAKLVLRRGWDRDFVYWWTRSGSFSDQAIEQTRTAAQPKLALERLGSIELPNADLTSQKALVACMERLRGSIQNLTEGYTGKLSELRDLRQSILQKAFAGELT